MREKRREKLLISGVVFLLILSTTYSMSYADVPRTINYQGYLTNDAGSPVDGTVDITFSIYDTDAGETDQWSENHSGVSVSNGIFSVILGETTPITASCLDSGNCYLGVSVGADPEMTPRQKLTSAPFAINADALDGLSSEEFIGTGNGGIISGSSTSGLLTVTNSDGSGHAMYGENSSSGNYGYIGGSTYSVYGEYGTESPDYHLHPYGFLGGEVEEELGYNKFVGVYGNGAPGVLGKHMSSGNYGKLGMNGAGVFGKNMTTQNRGGIGGSQMGVWGFGNDETMTGVFGKNMASNSMGSLGTYIIGVVGDGVAVGTLGVQGVYHPHGVGKENIGALGHEYYGVVGNAFSDNGQGVFGIHQSSYNRGYLGGPDYGVWGQYGETGPSGFFGGSDMGMYAGDGGSGTNYAGYFEGKVEVAGNVDADGFTVNGVPIGTTDWSENGSNIYFDSGNVAIGANDPGDTRLAVAGNVNISGSTDVAEHEILTVWNSGVGVGAFLVAEGANARAIRAWATNIGAGTNYGGDFSARGENGIGVSGSADTGADGVGVQGVAGGINARGVAGFARDTTGAGESYGGWFRAESLNGKGVYGWNQDITLATVTQGYLGGGEYGAYGQYGSTGNYGSLGGSSYGVYSGGDSYVAGDLTVEGTIESTSGGFKFPDGTTQTTSAGVSGYERVTYAENVSISIKGTITRSVSCSAGKKVIGGGLSSSGGGVVSQSYPSSDTQWTGTFYNPNTDPEFGQIQIIATVWAICITVQ